MSRIARIVSGGQTGVDRAALDVAVRLGVECGGWCPLGGWAEDHPSPPGLLAAYPSLREAPSTDPAERTRLNVRDSDATLVVSGPDVPSAGTSLTVSAAADLGRPCLVTTGDVRKVLAWLDRLSPGLTLNVAGPRGSEWPEGYDVARSLLEAVLAEPAGR